MLRNPHLFSHGLYNVSCSHVVVSTSYNLCPVQSICFRGSQLAFVLSRWIWRCSGGVNSSSIRAWSSWGAWKWCRSSSDVGRWSGWLHVLLCRCAEGWLYVLLCRCAVGSLVVLLCRCTEGWRGSSRIPIESVCEGVLVHNEVQYRAKSRKVICPMLQNVPKPSNGTRSVTTKSEGEEQRYQVWSGDLQNSVIANMKNSKIVSGALTDNFFKIYEWTISLSIKKNWSVLKFLSFLYSNSYIPPHGRNCILIG